jgi:hypothetical protein
LECAGEGQVTSDDVDTIDAFMTPEHRGGRIGSRCRALLLSAVLVSAFVSDVTAQSQPAAAPGEPHQHTDPGPIDVFPMRDASGTAWQPDTSPMSGMPRPWRGWSVMLHGNVFAQFLYEPGDRHRTGGTANEQASSVNWIMGMARRPLGAGRLGVRAMVSAEPWTVSDCGFLNYLASGEICEGDTIHDRQHPHDLFMELAADYDRSLRGSLRWQLYAGLAGEPALGPSGFPHRLSAMPNPVAPIAHHWLDATHISFGVITTGVYDRRWKAELSLFNGREPDATRWDLDVAALDSVAGRFWLMPSDRLALQVSAGHLNDAEAGLALQPRSDVDRATASATYHRPQGGGIWATTMAYGVNAGREITAGGVFDGVTHALLLESSLEGARHTWFGRAEVMGKPAHDLHAHEYGTRVFTVGKLQAGYTRSWPVWKGLTAGLGATVTASLLPPELAPRYSGRVAPALGVFFRLHPVGHVM